MTSELKPGWLKRQAEQVEKDIKQWPMWMQEELRHSAAWSLERQNTREPGKE